MVCDNRNKKKHKEATKRQHTGVVAVSRDFLSNSEHIFTCSGGGFCPGLGEEELEVAAAGLVGLCCFAKRE